MYFIACKMIRYYTYTCIIWQFYHSFQNEYQYSKWCMHNLICEATFLRVYNCFKYHRLTLASSISCKSCWTSSTSNASSLIAFCNTLYSRNNCYQWQLHMAFFISYPWSALGSEISAKEVVGLKADEIFDMKTAMLWTFYHILGTRRHFRKLTNYNVISSGTMWYIFIMSLLR